MKKSRLMIAVFTTLVLGANLFADISAEPRHELGLGINPLLGYGGRTTGADAYTDLGSNGVIAIAADYDFAVVQALQLGANVGLAYLSTGTTSLTALQMVAGPTINIPFSSDWLYNSLFLSLRGGLLLVDSGGSSTEAMLTGDFGYRVKLADHVTWRPSLGASKLLNGSKFLFAVRLVSFSIVF